MYWAAAQLQPNRTRLALRLLDLNGYQTYSPRFAERRVIRQRRVDVQAELFPGYVFVLIVHDRWYQAHWCPGVSRIVLAGDRPAVVSDDIIDGLRQRERNGLIELSKPPRLRRGDRVRIVQGPFREHLALYEGLTGRERVAVLLQLLGGQQRAELPAAAIEPFKGVS
jgi:transcriptional antiterminator RfaH